MQTHRSWAVVIGTAALSLSLLASNAHAQRLHVNGLIGEPPDVSNWPHPAAPDGNRYPRSTASSSALAQRKFQEQLGKLLFWEEQVSSDNTMSCGTCHIPSAGGTDLRAGGLHPSGNIGAFGMIRQHQNGLTGDIDYGFVAPPSNSIDRQVTGLHTPTMIGSYVFNQLFWDMRAGPDFVDNSGTTIPNFTDWASSEDLSVGPVVSDVEMGHEGIDWGTGFIQDKLNESYPLALVDPATVPPDVAWLVSSGATYRRIFDKVFHLHPQFGGFVGVTRERFAMAVAHYMRTLIPDQAPIDQGTMTPNQVDGFIVMQNSGCFVCHSATGGPTLTTPGGILADPFDNPLSDGQLHDIGFGPVKTPTLRNVGLRERFFSTGQVATLNDLVDFYENQPFGPPFQLIGSGPGGTLTPGERNAVLDFLKNALTDPRVAAELPPFDRPELASERSEFFPFETNEYGVGTAGPSGTVPEIIANSPPLVTKPLPGGGFPVNWFKIGVGHCPPNRPAFLLVNTLDASGPTLWVAPGFTVVPSGNTNPQGIATAHVPFPLTTATIGTAFYTQWMIDDFGIRAFSNAAKFSPFQF